MKQSETERALADLNEESLLVRIDRTRLPKHIAVIMDGNRRWAKARHLPAVMGHRAGVKAFRRVMETCRSLGVRNLTAYAFSAENWCRAASEVKVLMQLFEYYSKSEREEMLRTGIRFRTIGDLSGLPQNLQEAFNQTSKATEHNTEMVLNLAVNYGGREEIVKAAKCLAQQCEKGQLTSESINAEVFADQLWTSGCPDPDLLIRTSGELRVSNFLLWQIAYAEFWFSEQLWPDVDAKTVYRAIIAYQQRERRYGGQ